MGLSGDCHRIRSGGHFRTQGGGGLYAPGAFGAGGGGYSLAFYFLSLTLRTIPLGVTYAIWSGVGVALITLIGWTYYHQALNLPSLIGIALIVAGVVVLSLYAETGPQ